MSIIKSPLEAVREKMHECADVLAVKFVDSVRPVYGSNNQGRPRHIGSCLLVSINDEKYLVTAAHIIDWSAETFLYVAGEKKLVEVGIGCKWILTNKVGGLRVEDKFDFGFLRLSDGQVEELGEVVYFEEGQVFIGEPSGKLVVAVGYLNSRNKKIRSDARAVPKNPLSYCGVLIHNKNIFEKVGLDSSTHFLVKFEKESKDEYGKLVSTPPPKGVSGGGLFYVCNFSSPSIYKPGSKLIGKLAGVLIEYKKKEKVLIAVRMSIVISEIKKHLL